MILQKKTEHLSWGARIECQVDEQGRKQGEAIMYDRENRVRWHLHYKDDQLDGLWEWIYKNGKFIKKEKVL